MVNTREVLYQNGYYENNHNGWSTRSSWVFIKTGDVITRSGKNDGNIQFIPFMK